MQEMNHKEVAAKSEEFKKVESVGKDGLQFADVLSETWGAKSAVKNDVNNGVKIGVGKEKELSFDDCYKGADKSAIKLEDGEIKGGKPAIKLEDGGIKPMDGGIKEIIKKPMLDLDDYSFLKKGA